MIQVGLVFCRCAKKVVHLNLYSVQPRERDRRPKKLPSLSAYFLRGKKSAYFLGIDS